MKVQKIRLSALAIGILLSLMVLLSAIFTIDVPFIADAADTSVVDYDKYTDSDTLLNGSKTIREYPDTLYNSTTSIKGNVLNVYGDDPIVQIVPKSLFAASGEYLHIGKEYGFFIKTEVDAWGDSNNKKSQVLVFDITTNMTDPKNPDVISVSIEPLFQYCFCYIESQYTKFATDERDTIQYTIPANTNYVVATPIGLLPPRYGQTWKYYLKNISVSSTLANEQGLNPMNSGYSVLEDDGYFFTQFDYKYNGFTSPKAEDDGGITLDDVSMVFSVLSLLPIDGLSTAFGLLSLFFTCLAEEKEMQSINDGSGHYGTSISNGVITATNLYSTKADQIANYFYGGESCLIKNAICGMHGDDNKNNIWFGKDNSVSAYYKLSHTEKLYTRFAREIGLTVVDEKGNEYNKDTCSEYNYFINEPNYSSVGLDEKTRLTILPDGNNYFKFAPLHTSDYQIAFDNNQNAEVFVTSGSNAVATTKENGIISCRMTVGETYQIRIHKKTAGDFNFTLSPSTSMPAIASKSEYLIKYVPSDTGAYKLSVVNSGFLISKAYHNTPENDYASLLGVTKGLNCKDFEAVLKKDDIYYLLLKNNTSASASSGIASTACSSTWKAGANASKALVGGANYVYSKFVLGKEESDVCFSFSGVDSTAVNVQFYVFNQYGESKYIIEQYYDGFMRLAQLSAGTYYIGMRAAKNVTVTPKVELKDVAGKWKQLINGKWTDVVLDNNNEIVVYRGDTHYFSYWRGDTVFHSYRPEYNLYEFNNEYVKFIDAELKFKTTENAFDNCKTTLFAMLRSDTENGNMMFPEGLAIRVKFNMKEINPVFSVDYVNKIKISFKSDVIANNLKYIIRSNVSNGSAISDFITGTVTNSVKSVDLEIMQKLCNRKATTAKFVLKSIEIKSGLNNESVRTIDINKVYDINCKEQRYDSENSIAYISNELHLYNLRYPKYNVKFANDITLNSFKVWDPIPQWNKTLYGDSFAIKNQMVLTVPYSNRLLYGFVQTNNGIRKGLKIEDFIMDDVSSDTSGEMRFGAIAAINNGEISGCSASGSIKVDRKSGVVGGIAGINNKSGKINLCAFGGYKKDNNILFNSGDVGGIVGRNMGGQITLNGCANTYVGCYVNKCGNSFGCIVGYASGGTIQGCFAKQCTMDIRNTTLVSGYYPKMGFIVGHMVNQGSMERCLVIDCTYYHGRLTVGYRKYCYNGKNGCYGLVQNSTVKD